MIAIASNEILPDHLRGCVVAIGNFDGLHRGHQHLLAIAKDVADAQKKPWGILTFEPHPRSYFRPQEPVFRLTPAALKRRLAKALGAAFVMSIAFDEALANSTPEDFIKTHLIQGLGLSHIVTGYDFHFGKGRKGGSDTLREQGIQQNFGVTVVDQVTDDGDSNAPYSSSSIRSSLRRGHMRQAAHELGYDWMVMGEVVHGDKRGRTIGFPTANIILEPGAEPYRGIYAVTVRDAAGSEKWQGAAYFGDRPTFNTNRTFLEVFLLDQDIDLYGRTLIVSFVDLVRGDKTFKSVEELVAQMQLDCTEVRKILRAQTVSYLPLAKAQAAGTI